MFRNNNAKRIKHSKTNFTHDLSRLKSQAKVKKVFSCTILQLVALTSTTTTFRSLQITLLSLLKLQTPASFLVSLVWWESNLVGSSDEFIIFFAQSYYVKLSPFSLIFYANTTDYCVQLHLLHCKYWQG